MRFKKCVYLPFKRLIDVIGSLIGIVFCFVLLWWWVIPVNTIVTKGHPFFNRHRIGKNGKAFRCLKFRTMNVNVDPHLSSNEIDSLTCVTKFGKFLRATSIDETLQLFNVLFNQMSFIGPRPLIDVSGDIVTINERKKNGSIILKPGISGYAQIHGRAEVDPILKAELDYYYLQHFSFILDVKIFVYTILRLFGAVKGK